MEANYTYPFHVLEIVLIPNILQSLSATSAHETWLRNTSNDHFHNTRISNFAEGGDIPYETREMRKRNVVETE